MDANFITYKGKQIYFINFSGLRIKEIEKGIEFMEKCKKDLECLPKKSVLLLISVEDAEYNIKFVKRMKEIGKYLEPYIIKTGNIGVSGLKRVIFEAVHRYAGTISKTFDTKELALEWLIKEDV